MRWPCISSTGLVSRGQKGLNFHSHPATKRQNKMVWGVVSWSPLSVGSWTCIFTQQRRARMRFAFCSLPPGIDGALLGAELLPLGSSNRQEEGEWSSTCWQTTLPTRAVSVGLDRGGEGWTASPSQGQNKVVQGGTGQHATFSPPLVSVGPEGPEPLPPKWQAGRMARMQTGAPLSSLVSPEPCGELNTHPTWIC